MTAETILTTLGPATVLHRLALGLTIHDVVTDRASSVPARVGWEASGHLLPHGRPDWWPCVDFERVGGGRFRLRASTRIPQTLTVRIADPTRQLVPRRLLVPLWPYADLVAPGTVAVASRTLHVWLYPGAACLLPAGSTAVRGRVTGPDGAVAWARVSAVDSDGNVLGAAHVDDRGEFLLLVTDTFQNPLPSTVSARLVVHGPAGPTPLPPVEPVTRPADPPGPGDLDNALLRGRTPPAAHLPNTAPATQLTVKVGEELTLAADVTFVP